MKQKGRVVFWCGYAALMGLLIGWALLSPRPDDPLHHLYIQCMRIKPGVTVESLTRLFGTPEHVKKDGYEAYLFGSYEYSVMYSDYIVAVVNEKGDVTDFRCGEGAYPWRPKSTAEARTP